MYSSISIQWLRRKRNHALELMMETQRFDGTQRQNMPADHWRNCKRFAAKMSTPATVQAMAMINVGLKSCQTATALSSTMQIQLNCRQRRHKFQRATINSRQTRATRNFSRTRAAATQHQLSHRQSATTTTHSPLIRALTILSNPRVWIRRRSAASSMVATTTGSYSPNAASHFMQLHSFTILLHSTSSPFHTQNYSHNRIGRSSLSFIIFPIWFDEILQLFFLSFPILCLFDFRQ